MHVLRVATALVALDLRVLTDEEHLAAQTGQTGSEGRQQSTGCHESLQMVSVSVDIYWLYTCDRRRNIKKLCVTNFFREYPFFYIISTFAMLKRRFSIRPRPTGSFRRFAANSEERNFWTKFDSREFSRETFEASAILFREKPPENLLEAQELLREVGSQSELIALGCLHLLAIQIESTKWTNLIKILSRLQTSLLAKWPWDATWCDFHLDFRTFSDRFMQFPLWVDILSCRPFHTCFTYVSYMFECTLFLSFFLNSTSHCT